MKKPAILILTALMGFAVYWPLTKISELAYKTSLLGGRWEVGAAGMQRRYHGEMLVGSRARGHPDAHRRGLIKKYLT